ncbi:protein toll-like [Parasteatoda tepidariorum]|uniref:protein toll-like n=1 Tax=Parasteatoda tepidariorum TaxID=114398 RepID=UPI001C71A2C3|nr:protein toll-like [Parasteatoda tepidariorum]
MYGICLLLTFFALVICTDFDLEDDSIIKNCSELLQSCNCFNRYFIGDDCLGQNYKVKCSELDPYCGCENSEIIAKVSCWNATELFSTKYLVDGSIYERNATYEIVIEGGVTTLPSRSLDGLIVFSLILDNPDINHVHENAFEGALSMRRFHVRHSSLKEVPNFRPVYGSSSELRIDNSLLTYLKGDALKNLPFLEYISFVNNSIQHIDSDVFEGTNSVIHFDLSYNKLSYLPPHLFDPWDNLRNVSLSHNQLLHVKDLFTLARPHAIYLGYNNITDLDAILPSITWNLTTLRLSYNPIRQLSSDFLHGKAPLLRYLYLDHCLIQVLNENKYYNLRIHLHVLDLSYNRIEKVNPTRIDFGFRNYKSELVLEGNLIREFKVGVHNVRKINLANNRLRSLVNPLKHYLELTVAKNELRQLVKRDFYVSQDIRVLKVQENQIKWIDSSFFDNMEYLGYLDLSYNLLESLNSSVQRLPRLKYLNLSSNLITVLEEREFVGLVDLIHLNISGNKIVVLGSDLRWLPRLSILDLSNNRIRTLRSEHMPNSLQYLYIRDNPIRCDCELLPFIKWLNLSETDVDIDLCRSVLLYTPNHVQSCPSTCECYCTNDIEKYFMAVDCSFRNISTLPQFLAEHSAEDSSHLEITLQPKFQRNTGDIVIVHSIGEINLSHNNLDTLESARLPVGLRNLFLHNNRFKAINTTWLRNVSNFQQLTLSGNPWICDCDTANFRKWILSNEKIILDGNQTLCDTSGDGNVLEGKAIWTLREWDLCPLFIGLYFSVGFGLIIFFLVITILKILHTRYKLNIDVWLYAHGVIWVKEKDIDRDKIFDAFISFSHNDQDLVITDIISVLEVKQPMTRLCLHYKHFIAGEYIDANIFTAVQNSKRTVIVLSKNFLESEWCVYEFRAAHMQALKDKVNRVIIIKLGELPDDAHPDIKLYLKSTTYLTWGEKYFWDKLLYVLPVSSTKDSIKNRTSYPI